MLEFNSDSGISLRQIKKHGYRDLCKKAGLAPNANTKMSKDTLIESRPPKILTLDIETAPVKAYVYGMWDQNISTKQIVSDWFMISWAAKWLDGKRIMYDDSSKQKDVSNDKKICISIHKLISEADILIGHNIDKFDIKKLNTRFLAHGLDPIGKKQTVDTLKISRKYFKVTSNRLDFLAKFLGIEGKYKSQKYNGFDLWIACCNRNLEAYKENKIYNKQDVTITEQVFEKLKKWDISLNFQAYYQDTVCVCGSKSFHKDGIIYTKAGIFQRYRCRDCRKTCQSKHNILTNQDKASMKMK